MSAITTRPRDTSDEERNRSAVDRPGRAEDVGGALRAQEGDHRRYLVLGAEAPDRDLPARRVERLLATHAAALGGLIREPAVLHPQRALHRPRCDGVHEDAAISVG